MVPPARMTSRRAHCIGISSPSGREVYEAGLTAVYIFSPAENSTPVAMTALLFPRLSSFTLPAYALVMMSKFLRPRFGLTVMKGSELEDADRA